MATCFLMSGLLGLVWNLFALVILDIEGEFGWTRIETSFGFSLFALAHALSAPGIASLLARFGSRPVMLLLSLCLALGLAMTAVSNSLSSFYIFFGLLAGIGTQAFGSYFVFTLIADRIRTRPTTAMAMADAGSGAGLFVGLPLVQFLVATQGWRATFLIIAAIVLLAGSLAHLLLLPRLRVSPRRPAAERLGIGVAMRPTVLLGISMMLGAAVLQGMQTQQIAAFEALGATRATAVWIVSSSGLAMFGWRLASGFLADKYRPETVMLVAGAGAAVTFLSVGMFGTGGSVQWLTLYAMAIAVGFGAQGILFAAYARTFLAARDFRFLLSITRTSAGLGLFTGPLVAGASFQYAGGYTAMFSVMIILSALHFATFFAVRAKQ